MPSDWEQNWMLIIGQFEKAILNLNWIVALKNIMLAHVTSLHHSQLGWITTRKNKNINTIHLSVLRHVLLLSLNINSPCSQPDFRRCQFIRNAIWLGTELNGNNWIVWKGYPEPKLDWYGLHHHLIKKVLHSERFDHFCFMNYWTIKQ